MFCIYIADNNRISSQTDNTEHIEEEKELLLLLLALPFSSSSLSLSWFLSLKIMSRRLLVVSPTDLENTITIIIRHLLLDSFSWRSHHLDCIIFFCPSLSLSDRNEEAEEEEKILTSVSTSRHQKQDETERFIIRHHHQSCLLPSVLWIYQWYTSACAEGKSVCSANYLSCSRSIACLDTQLDHHSL